MLNIEKKKEKKNLFDWYIVLWTNNMKCEIDFYFYYIVFSIY